MKAVLLALAAVLLCNVSNAVARQLKSCSSGGCDNKEVDRMTCRSGCGCFVEDYYYRRGRVLNGSGGSGRGLRSDAHALEVLSRGLEEGADDEVEAERRKVFKRCADCDCCGTCTGACCAYSEEKGKQMCFEDVDSEYCTETLRGIFYGVGSTCDDEGPDKCGKTACGETCGYDHKCESGCCVKPSFLDFDFAAPIDRQLLGEEEGQCGDKEWCDCNEKYPGNFNLFIQCMSCPFVCDEAKPIDKLVMKLVQHPPAPSSPSTASTPVYVRAFNNDKCEGDVLHEKFVELWDHFGVEAPEGGKLKKDLLWCFYPDDYLESRPFAASKFHISCSDDDLNDDEDCGKHQGFGKDSGSGSRSGSRINMLMKKGGGGNPPLFNGWKLVKMEGSGAKGGGVRLSLNCELMDMSHTRN